MISLAGYYRTSTEINDHKLQSYQNKCVDVAEVPSVVDANAMDPDL
jgi:hypothetical protein